MKYKFIHKVEGKMIENVFDDLNVIPAMEVRGYNLVGFNANPRQRAELQYQPVFGGVEGPLYDGPHCVRYETQEVYQTLSN